jgi:hypothetical protein
MGYGVGWGGVDGVDGVWWGEKGEEWGGVGGVMGWGVSVCAGE